MLKQITQMFHCSAGQSDHSAITKLYPVLGTLLKKTEQFERIDAKHLRTAILNKLFFHLQVIRKVCFQLEKTVLGPVVQSIVSLTSSLRGQLVKCFTTLYPNTLIFFLLKK